jgi:hypothetical protein
MTDDDRDSEWLSQETASLNRLQSPGGRRRSREASTALSADAVAHLDLNGQGTCFDVLLLTRTNVKEFVMLGKSGQLLFHLASIGSGRLDPREEAEIMESAICALETTGMLQCRKCEDTRWDLPQASH